MHSIHALAHACDSTRHGQPPAGRASDSCTCSPGRPVTGVTTEEGSQGLMSGRESRTPACGAEGGRRWGGQARRVRNSLQGGPRGHALGQISGLSSGASCFRCPASSTPSGPQSSWLLLPCPPGWGKILQGCTGRAKGRDSGSGVGQFQSPNNEPTVLLSFVLFQVIEIV